MEILSRAARSSLVELSHVLLEENNISRGVNKMAKDTSKGGKHGRKSVPGTKASPKPTQAKSPIAKGGAQYPQK
jgi:hypothetical protein